LRRHADSPRLTALAVALLLAAGAFGAARSASAAEPAKPTRGPSTEKERLEALRLVELLETSPTAGEAAAARQTLVVWLGEVPDLEIRFCSAILGSAKEIEAIPQGLALQPALSQAAYQIRHPQARPNDLEVFVAGLEGALRAYDAMRVAGGTESLPLFESLRGERARGRLLDVVQARLKNCK
jgi:hypothetical protein